MPDVHIEPRGQFVEQARLSDAGGARKHKAATAVDERVEVLQLRVTPDQWPRVGDVLETSRVIPDAGTAFCYLSTTGRVTGRPHRIEIWFAAAPANATIYLLAGGRERSDWVANLLASPACTVEIGSTRYPAIARVLREGTDEDELARTLVHDKYAQGDDLVQWRGEALPVAIDLGKIDGEV
jgi:deazaflavin-dependent oxidoreductase (nitroreductase family)